MAADLEILSYIADQNERDGYHQTAKHIRAAIAEISALRATQVGARVGAEDGDQSMPAGEIADNLAELCEGYPGKGAIFDGRDIWDLVADLVIEEHPTIIRALRAYFNGLRTISGSSDLRRSI